LSSRTSPEAPTNEERRDVNQPETIIQLKASHASQAAPGTDDLTAELTVEDIEAAVTRNLEQIRVVPDPILSAVRVSVVLPTLNEADNLAHVFQRMPREVHEVILVDGDSTDPTVDVARRLWPGLIVIKQSGKGKGNALACGFWTATGDVVVWLDADGSTDPAHIRRFVAALLAGADFAKGSRFMAGGGSADITRLRRAGNTALTKLVNALWNTYFTDITYGYNAFWRRHLPQISPPAEGFEGEIATYIRAARAGLRVHDVPSFEHHRHSGASNLNARRDGMRVLRTIISEWIRPY
jgi:glycosyltransferase involved in cell wall biosynthesis